MEFYKINSSEIAEFKENGAICLRKVFSPRWINLVKEGIERNIANPSPFGESLKVNESDTGAYFDDYCNWKSIQEFKEYVFESPAASIVGQLMESDYRSSYLF